MTTSAVPAGAATAAAVPADERRTPGRAAWIRDLCFDLAREHASIFVLLAAYVAAAFTIDAAFAERDIVELRVYDQVFFVMLEAYAVIFFVGFSIYEVRRMPNRRSVVGWLWTRLRRDYLTAERIGAFALMVLYARVLTDTFVSLKAAIPLIQPFAWDATLLAWDRALHGGHDPWTLVQRFATPEVTGLLSFLYNAWIFVLFAVFIWQAWTPVSAVRKRFFLTFGLAWILLGGAAATGLSSAGPCYYARVTHAAHDPYAPLMSYLREVDAHHHRVWALDVQETLWSAYVQQSGMPSVGVTSDGSGKEMMQGISAMPSMHVAMAVLFALVGWRASRMLGAILAIYAVAIQIGSVHLGWHYALDGYVSAIAVMTLWMVVGRAVSHRSGAHRLASR